MTSTEQTNNDRFENLEPPGARRRLPNNRRGGSRGRGQDFFRDTADPTGLRGDPIVAVPQPRNLYRGRGRGATVHADAEMLHNVAREDHRENDAREENAATVANPADVRPGVEQTEQVSGVRDTRNTRHDDRRFRENDRRGNYNRRGPRDYDDRRAMRDNDDRRPRDYDYMRDPRDYERNPREVYRERSRSPVDGRRDHSHRESERRHVEALQRGEAPPEPTEATTKAPAARDVAVEAAIPTESGNTHSSDVKEQHRRREIEDLRGPPRDYDDREYYRDRDYEYYRGPREYYDDRRYHDDRRDHEDRRYPRDYHRDDRRGPRNYDDRRGCDFDDRRFPRNADDRRAPRDDDDRRVPRNADDRRGPREYDGPRDDYDRRVPRGYDDNRHGPRGGYDDRREPNVASQRRPRDPRGCDDDPSTVRPDAGATREAAKDPRDEPREIEDRRPRRDFDWRDDRRNDAQRPRGFQRDVAPRGGKVYYDPDPRYPNRTVRAPHLRRRQYEAEEVENLFAVRHNQQGISFENYDRVNVEIVPRVEPVNSFEELHIDGKLVDNIRKCGYSRPTPVQKYSFPVVLDGHDLMACAQTGSGKTAAFLVPCIQFMLTKGVSPAMNGAARPIALIMAPTRELASQIYDDARKLTFDTDIFCDVVYGGSPYPRHFDNDILVACPGRLKDLFCRQQVSFANTRILILDEADRMLEMGFEEQIEYLVASAVTDMPPPEKRQTLMFSATFPSSIRQLAHSYLREEAHILTLGKVGSTTTSITQNVEWVEDGDKRKRLLDIIMAQNQRDLVLVFAETKRETEELFQYLRQKGITVGTIHGDRRQCEREDALRRFKEGRCPVLVATDVASRGLDIPDVTHVVQYELPQSIDDYTHRIGRTGRAGNVGLATSFFNRRNSGLADELAAYLREHEQVVPEWMESMREERHVAAFQRQVQGGGAAKGRHSRGKGGGGGGGPAAGGVKQKEMERLEAEFSNEPRRQKNASQPPPQVKAKPTAPAGDDGGF